MTKIIFCSDDSNETTQAVVGYLAKHADLDNWGVRSDWPVFSKQAAHRVVDNQVDRAVLMCWTGTGTAIAANKIKGARAAQASDPWTAENARRWNDANILTMSLKQLTPEQAVDILNTFLSIESPDPEEIDNIALIE
ncbi:MAG: RpiB/LacA/LacB family sugar-phosphate isomerase [Patescibacteria group bacterium]